MSRLVGFPIIAALLVVPLCVACGSGRAPLSVSTARPKAGVSVTETTSVAAPLHRPIFHIAQPLGADTVSEEPNGASVKPITIAQPADLGGNPTTSWLPDGTALAIVYPSSNDGAFSMTEQVSPFKSAADLKAWALALPTYPGSTVTTEVVTPASGDGEYMLIQGPVTRMLVWQSPDGTRVDVYVDATTTDAAHLINIGDAITGTNLVVASS